MNSNELPPIEIPELADALQAHVDAREGGEGRAGLERYVVVSTYIRADGTAGLEVVTNTPDAEAVLDLLKLGVRCVEPSVPSTVDTTSCTDAERQADEVTPDDEMRIEEARLDRPTWQG